MIITMENPSCASLKILFFAALLLPLFAGAAAVDDAALKYLLSDEASSATITNFSSGGSTYYMIFNNQAEIFVLKAESQGISIVSDKAALTAPLKDYIALKFGAPLSSEKVASIKSEYQWLNNLSRNCTTPITNLVLNPYQMQLIWDSGDYTGNTYRAHMRLTGQNGSKGIEIPGISNASLLQNKSNINKALLKGYIAVIVGGMNYLGEMSGNLSENGSTAENSEIMARMQSLIAEYKTPLTQYAADHNFMNKYYPGVLPKACTFTSSSFAKMDSLLVVTTLPSEAELADNLSKSAASRVARLAASADIAAIVASEQADTATLEQDVATVRQSLVKYGIATDGLDTRLSEVKTALERTKKSMTKAEADSLHADFQAKLADASGFVGIFKQQSTAAALAAADASLPQAQSAIALAATRMGEGDTNVNNLNQTYETARVELASAKAQLAQGKSEGVTALTAATTKLAQVKTTAEGLNTVSGQTDILLIGFVLVIIIIAVVGFFSIRNRKKEPPVVVAAGPGTPGLKKTSSGIIVERK